jgi:4-aminobutyrate aminotransferase/(S)-3-amino-2-methylpropionate transaminase
VPARALLGSSGSDAVETALKTAMLATGHPGIIAFEGAYHGLSFGSLDATWRSMFRDPFAARIPHHSRFASYGDLDAVVRLADESSQPIGAVLIEPIQGRGGERVPPAGFLSSLSVLCRERGWLLIADEIYTGFGRTGDWFACSHEDVIPDLLCVGKGLASGMPISACVGRSEVMDAWPISSGEALHTQTFIGHPAACASALACIEVIEGEKLVARARELGARALQHLESQLRDRSEIVEVRGRGLMIGIEYQQPQHALHIVRHLLERGVITLPSGDYGEVLSLTPPLSIDEDVFFAALDLLLRS